MEGNMVKSEEEKVQKLKSQGGGLNLEDDDL